MITAGIYQKGNSAIIDEALDMHEPIEAFLKQEEFEPCPMQETLDKMAALTGTEIPAEEYAESPALAIPSTAQIVDEQKRAES